MHVTNTKYKYNNSDFSRVENVSPAAGLIILLFVNFSSRNNIVVVNKK